MIGSSSARIKERLTDGDVIVVEVIKEPLLGQGLQGVFDISLGGEVLVIGPISSATVRRVIYYLNSGKMQGRRKCWKMKRRKVKLMKKSRKSEGTLNSCMRHGNDHGME